MKGDASSERVRGCVIPARSCRSCGAGEGKAKAKAGGLGAALAGAQLLETRGLRERLAAWGRSPGLPARGSLRPAPLPHCPGGRDRSCRISANL